MQFAARHETTTNQKYITCISTGRSIDRWRERRTGARRHTHTHTHTHTIYDLLTLYDPSITYPTIGHVFAAPLIQFLSDSSRYILWLRGLTGSGKSFLARRVQQFFGNFQEKDIVSWTSTMNFVQLVGYFLRMRSFWWTIIRWATSRISES